MAVIRAKNPKLSGHVVGVKFTNGTAETDSPQALAFFRKSTGFTIEAEKSTTVAVPERQAD